MNARPATTDVAASAVGAPEGANQKGQNPMTEKTVNVPVEEAAKRLLAYVERTKWTFSPDDIKLVAEAALSAAALHEGEGEDWSELERLARATGEVADLSEGDWYGADHFRSLEPQDAAFIAAANPATILKLIASARAALSVPTPGGWIEWSGGENPVPGQTVDWKIEDASCQISGEARLSDRLIWTHNVGGGYDIIAYRIVPTPGGEG